MAKEPQDLKWIEALLPEEGYRRKSMFGGFAYYIDEKICLLMFESPGSRSYQGEVFPFEIWHGCMFPVEKEHQPKALQQFPFLMNHPVLPKWLYLPMDTEGFDDLVSEVVRHAIKPTSTWGSIPKKKSAPKANSGNKSAAKLDSMIDTTIDTRRPSMFSDEPAKAVLQRSEKIADLKNFGPVTEVEFRKAGIKSVQKFVELGWKKSLLLLIKVNPKNRHSLFAYAMIGALKNQQWNGLTAEDKAEARDFVQDLIAKEKMRSSKEKADARKAGAKKPRPKKASSIKKLPAAKKGQRIMKVLNKKRS